MFRRMDLQMFAEEVAEVEGEIITETTVPEPEFDKADFLKYSSFLKGATPQAGPATEETQEVQAQGTEAEVTVSGVTEETVTKPEVEPAAVEPPIIFKLPDGREYTPEKIDEMEKGYMMQKNYTVKTQALAEERRAFEAEKGKFNPQVTQNAVTLWQQMEVDPIGTIDKLREHYENQGIFEPKNEEQLKFETEKRQLEFEKQTLQQEKQQRAQQEHYQRIESQLTSLAEKHGKDFNREQTLSFMAENNIFDAEKAFKALHHDTLAESLQKQITELNDKLKTVKKEAVNEYVKEKTTKKATPPPVGASNSGSPPVQINPPKTLEDAKKAALARPWT